MLKITIENSLVPDSDASKLATKIGKEADKILKEYLKENNPLKEINFHDMV